MSFNCRLESSLRINSVTYGKKKRYHRFNHSQKKLTNSQYDIDGFPDCNWSNKDRRQENAISKKMQQIPDCCNDMCFIDEKRLYKFGRPPSDMYHGLISDEDDMVIDNTMQRSFRQYVNPTFISDTDGGLIDRNTYSRTNNEVEIEFSVVNTPYSTENSTLKDKKNDDILEECCEKFATIDEQMIDDLKKDLDYPQEYDLNRIISYIQNIPYDSDSMNPPDNQSIKSFRRQRQFSTKKMVSYLRNTRDNILNRCSYGFLIINKKKKQFLAVRNSRGLHCWSAPKGHQQMKHNDQWEKPLETAIREINEEIIYRNSKYKKWCIFNEELLKKYIAYLECVLESRASKYRRIGLFIVCVENDFECRPKDLKEIDDVKWFELEDTIDSKQFYTLYPFIQYLKNHPELLSR